MGTKSLRSRKNIFSREHDLIVHIVIVNHLVELLVKLSVKLVGKHLAKLLAKLLETEKFLVMDHSFAFSPPQFNQRIKDGWQECYY